MSRRHIVVSVILTCCLYGCTSWPLPKIIDDSGLKSREVETLPSEIPRGYVVEMFPSEIPRGYLEICVFGSFGSDAGRHLTVEKAVARGSSPTDQFYFSGGGWRHAGAASPQNLFWSTIVWRMDIANRFIHRVGEVPGMHTYRIYVHDSKLDPNLIIIDSQTAKPVQPQSRYNPKMVMIDNTDELVVGRTGRSGNTPMVSVQIVEGMVTPLSVRLYQTTEASHGLQPSSVNMDFHVVPPIPVAKLPTTQVATLSAAAIAARRICHYPEGLVADAHRPPVVRLSVPPQAQVGEAVTLDASASSDPDGDPLTYTWDFGDGTPPTKTTFPRATYSYAKIGNYTPKVTVDDGRGGTSSATAPLTIVQKFVLTEMGANMLFDFDKAVLKSEAINQLARVLQTLREQSGLQTQIVGHTDGLGTDAYNLKLSQRRAEAVAAYLVKNDVARQTMKIDGKGKREPVASNETAEGQAQNRRVELTLSPAGQ